MAIIVRDSKTGKILNVSRDIKATDITASRSKRVSSGRVVPTQATPFKVTRGIGDAEFATVDLAGNVTIKKGGKTVSKGTIKTTKAVSVIGSEAQFERDVKASRASFGASTKAKREVKTRISDLERLVKGKVLTTQGRVEAQRELSRLKATPIQKKIEEVRIRQGVLSIAAKAKRAATRKRITTPIIKLQELLKAGKSKSRIEKGLIKLSETLARTEGKREVALEDLKKFKLTDVVAGRTPSESLKIAKQRLGKQIKAVSTVASAGVVRAVSIIPLVALKPGDTVKQQIRAFTVDLPSTVRSIRVEALRDPIGVAAEFATFSKLAGSSGSILKRTPLGRFVLKEKFIFSLPKKFRVPVRTILDASLAQRKLKPFSKKQLAKVKFVQPKTMSSVEFSALLKVLKSKKLDSAVFGSAASRALSKNKTPKPEDLDIAVGDIDVFAKAFIKELPKAQRKNYVLKGEKIVRVGSKKALFDIKPLSRLRPDESIFGNAYLPVSRIKKVFDLQEKVFNVQKLERITFLLEETFKKTTSLKQKKLLQKKILKNNKKLFEAQEGLKLSNLPKTVKKLVPELEVPTSRLETFQGVKLTSFGEQTLRKGLGTLQSLLEKNSRRAKDPQSFLISLEVQLKALKSSKSKTLFKKNKIKKLSLAVKLLKSKDFLKLFDSKVKAKIMLEFPIIGKFDSKKVKGLSKKPVVEKVVLKEFKGVVKEFKVKPSKLREFKVSELPSKLPSRLPSKLPSRLPSSKLPSRLPSKIPKLSKIPSSKIPSKVPISKLPSKIPSKLPAISPSKIPSLKPSRLPSSKLPSRIPSKIPSKLPRKLPTNKFTPKKTKKRFKLLSKLKKIQLKKVKAQQPQPLRFTTTIVRPKKKVDSLRLFTGAELR